MTARHSLFINASVLLTDGDAHKEHAVLVEGETITWCGTMAELPAAASAMADEVIDCEGRLLTPGLIDCHTHLVYAGDRAAEFEQRLKGVSYAEIARAGGGIQSTVNAVREASEDQLFAASLPRLQALMQHGVTTVEIKSGYGLSLDHELKMLRVAKRLGEHCGIRIVPTFLGAHALPKEFAGRADDYIDVVCNEMLPQVADLELASMVDVFCESIGFNLAQTERVLQSAVDLGFMIKCHAEQLSDLGASFAAAKLGAKSCEHVEFISEASVIAMAELDTVAVLLPGAFYFLKETQEPPIEIFRKHGVKMALATDLNPGSSPCAHLPLIMNMGCTLFGLTVAEAWQGVTRNAALALGLETTVGAIQAGQVADLVLWECQTPATLCYGIAQSVAHKVMVGGCFHSFRV